MSQYANNTTLFLEWKNTYLREPIFLWGVFFNNVRPQNESRKNKKISTFAMGETVGLNWAKI